MHPSQRQPTNSGQLPLAAFPGTSLLELALRARSSLAYSAQCRGGISLRTHQTQPAFPQVQFEGVRESGNRVGSGVYRSQYAKTGGLISASFFVSSKILPEGQDSGLSSRSFWTAPTVPVLYRDSWKNEYPYMWGLHSLNPSSWRIRGNSI